MEKWDFKLLTIHVALNGALLQSGPCWAVFYGQIKVVQGEKCHLGSMPAGGVKTWWERGGWGEEGGGSPGATFMEMQLGQTRLQSVGKQKVRWLADRLITRNPAATSKLLRSAPSGHRWGQCSSTSWSNEWCLTWIFPHGIGCVVVGGLWNEGLIFSCLVDFQAWKCSIVQDICTPIFAKFGDKGEEKKRSPHIWPSLSALLVLCLSNRRSWHPQSAGSKTC